MTLIHNVYKLQPPKRIKKPHKIFAIVLASIFILVLIGVIIYFIVDANTKEASIVSIKGAVVTNGYSCAKIGASILDRGGSAVEAAIAALFCEGVSMPQSMGLGGGFIMTIYDKDRRTAQTLNARETAPAAATEDMFGGDSEQAVHGGKAVAVPGELKGYWEAYQMYGGKVPWKDLVQPTIDLCNEGILVTPYLERLYASQRDALYQDVGLREAFIDPATNQTYTLNQKVKRTRLAKTLELIKKEGADVLYNGSLTAGFVKDIQDNGGIITEEDLKNYNVEWQDSIKIDIPFNQVLYTAPLPGSGVILGFIMNILNGFLDYSQPDSITNWQRIVESFKWGYGRRTELGDMNFLDIDHLVSNLTSASYAEEVRKYIFDDLTSQDPEYYGANTTQMEDHGTAHVSVLAPNGDAVSVTSTINLYFGAQFMSTSTGIILNDEMDDFSSPNITSSFDIPPSIANYIRPGKRPLSSMSPSIIINQAGDVELIVGAAGGTKITTSVAQIIIKNLWFNISIQEAVTEKRLHHQLFPMVIEFEQKFQEDMTLPTALGKIGHNCSIADAGTGFSAVTAISRKDDVIKTATDERRTGDVGLVN